MLPSFCQLLSKNIFSASLLSLLSVSMMPAQAKVSTAGPMAKEAFVQSLKQSALTLCALRKLDMDYKVALNTSATPVFQLIKFQHGMKIQGISVNLDETRLIRYLGYEISVVTLQSCRELLPPSVVSDIQKIKQQMNP